MDQKTPLTPELDRQRAAIESGHASQVQDFIDWLGPNGYAIVRTCTDPVHRSDLTCGVCEGTGYAGPVSNFQKLMAEHFGIDEDKIEAERLALLEWIRERP